MAEKPILELSTLVPDRPIIKIDGQSYEMAVYEDLSFKDEALLKKAGRMLVEASKAEDPTNEQFDELAQLVNRSLRVVVPGIPDDVFHKLPDGHKVQILMAFTRAARRTILSPPSETGATKNSNRRTSVKSSRSSKGSTAGGRKTGS